MIMWNHVATSVDADEGEVARRLDGANLASIVLELEVLERSLGVRLLAGPFELFGPGKVAEPVADIIRILTDSSVLKVLEVV